VGDANTGSFYYPNLSGDLVLTEATASPSTFDWKRTAVAQTCSEFCANMAAHATLTLSKL